MNASDTTVGGWGSSNMRLTHLPAILALMPAVVQSGIREVNKLTSAGNGSNAINTTADKLFLLSEVEIFIDRNNSYAGEGTQYVYYKTDTHKVKNYKGSEGAWWERSPSRNKRTYFCNVSSKGLKSHHAAGNSYGVAFAFCF